MSYIILKEKCGHLDDLTKRMVLQSMERQDMVCNWQQIVGTKAFLSMCNPRQPSKSSIPSILIISVYHPHNKLQIQGHKKNEVAQETHKPKNHRKQPVSLSFMDNGIRLNNDRE